MRTVAVVTGARADYGLYLPVLREIERSGGLRLRLLVTGAHLAPEFGLTVRAIEADGFSIDERVDMLLSSDTPEAVAKSMGLGVLGFAQVYQRCRPDLLLVLGDRYEMYAAVVAALPFRLPVAHIHGGELTEGVIDDAIRHTITKMSHLHFVTTEIYARRVIQMGEEPWRVVVSGAPGLDNLRTERPLERTELQAALGQDLTRPFLLVTFHPPTLEGDGTEAHVRELLAALEMVDFDLLFTYPNADVGGRAIAALLEEFVRRRPRSRIVANLGTRAYLSVMRHARAMVGNSSSGIIEAASLRLPVVNIGSRQRGRVRAANVIDVEVDRREIRTAISRATSADFAAGLADLVNLYGDGHAAERIVGTLSSIPLDNKLMMKRFLDIR